MTEVSEIPKLLSAAETAKLLGISAPTLRETIREGKIGFTLVGRRRRFTAGNINEYLKQNARSIP